MKALLRSLPAALLLMGSGRHGYADDILTVGVGVDYSTGAYGESIDTEILFIPVFLKWERDPWTVKLSVPHVTLRGPGRVILNGDKPLAAGEESETITTESGLGDITLGVTRTLWSGAALALDMTAKIKFPTADDNKGLGTGETDLVLMADIYGSFGRAAAFAGAGHRWMGQPPGENYRDVWSGNLGLSYKLDPRVSVGWMYEYRQSASRRQPGASEISPFAGFKLGEGLKLQWYGTVGLSESSQDWGTGVVLQHAF